nr:uncharacterized protein LOC117691721 isoform X4 [Crassostrea gigas]
MIVPSDVDSDPFSVSNYSPSSDSESDENKKVLESTPNSLRASRNTMEKQGILTLRENSEHFEAEPTPVSLRSSCNTMEKQDSLTLRVHHRFIESYPQRNGKTGHLEPQRKHSIPLFSLSQFL